jgi:hypothetical protein
LPPRLARLGEVQATGIALTNEDPYEQGFPFPEELPEVDALMGEGWRPLHGAPLYCLLPAAWPAELRTWVSDRLPKVGMGGTTDTYWSHIVAPPDEDWHDDFAAEHARAVGLPDPPAERIWLLRSPWPRIPVSVIYDIIWSVVERNNIEDEIAEVYRVASAVLTWDEHEALDACPADVRELLDAWADAGRVGEAASELIERRLAPRVLDDALERTQLDEPTLLAWASSLDTDLDDDMINFINAWRARGLPGNPPTAASRYLERDLAELQTWLDAGFDLYAAAQLELAGLASAIRWREAGFDEADTYELLRCDPALTPEEASAFDEAGLPHERRRDWIYYGFTAAQAADWTAVGLTPYQARIWRACDKEPADVEPGQRFPPQLLKGRRFIGFSRRGDGELTTSEWDEIPDPPETRGRRARRWRGDDDPWINTD